MTGFNLNLFKKGGQSTDLTEEKKRLTQEWDELKEKEAAFSRRDELGRIHLIHIDRISPNPSQPRKSFEDDAIIRLADSIRQYGVLQPLTVRRLTQDDSSIGAIFEIVAGERRLRAAKLLNLHDVPCIIIDVDSQKSAELAIIENIQRENLNIFEQAGAIAALIDIYDLTQEQIAKQLSTSQSYVANKLRILRLTARERELILQYNLTERHARALLKIDEVEKRIKIIEYISAKGLNVATTEEYIERLIIEESVPKEKDKLKTQRKIILKDIRIFYNSIDRAVSMIKQAGIYVVSEKKEQDDSVELTIRIPKSQINKIA